MSERIVNDPSLHGWVFENNKWVWEGGATTGHIEDGTVQGQITTWDVAKTEWTPDSSLVIDATGNATFTGTVDAAGFTVNGQPISGDHSGNNLVIENPLSPENEKKWRFNVNQQSGRLRIQNLNDDDSIKQSDFVRFNQDNSIAAIGSITAPDFIATSDERAKDNITTAPVGLIDSLKGREWEWKESGEKGSGVVAQELEQVLPHLVHEDDEGMKSVSYMGLCAYLIEELKDCRERLAVLESKE